MEQKRLAMTANVLKCESISSWKRSPPYSPEAWILHHASKIVDKWLPEPLLEAYLSSFQTQHGHLWCGLGERQKYHTTSGGDGETSGKVQSLILVQYRHFIIFLHWKIPVYCFPKMQPSNFENTVQGNYWYLVIIALINDVWMLAQISLFFFMYKFTWYFFTNDCFDLGALTGTVCIP